MTHIHKKTGYEFDIGELPTFDMTIIGYWRDPEDDGCLPFEFVDYYFGEYDAESTDFYIERWLKNRAKEKRVLHAAKDFMTAYRVTNEDVLDNVTFGRLIAALDECDELISNRDWRLNAKHPKEWYEADNIQKVLNDVMEAPGDTSIKIIVERKGQTTTADLYDHAALVTSLYDSLEYFKSEL